MFIAALRLLALLIALSFPSGAESVAVERPSSLAVRSVAPLPHAQSLTITGGSLAERKTVADAVARFAELDLALPTLEIRLHSTPTACGEFRGYFSGRADGGVIDLCFPGEFLVLHELGHAWAFHNLDTQARNGFVAFIGADAWNDPEDLHSQRATETAADAIAHGLLSTPLAQNQPRTREFEQFEVLTGRSTPRLAEVEAVAPVETLDAKAQQQLGAYAAWRQAADGTRSYERAWAATGRSM